MAGNLQMHVFSMEGAEVILTGDDDGALLVVIPTGEKGGPRATIKKTDCRTLAYSLLALAASDTRVD